MATEVKNTSEDAEMADCEEEKFVTMMDVLQEQEDIEEDANAVLGASDDKNCTYPKGYIKRQALYACLSCCPEAKDDPAKRAGVCLACSLTCHENHELVELYTKRNFKCDCGNPKFNSHPCQFTPNKTELNENNIYNQNFSGLYCICHRPYPDPESTVDEVMIQCIICEDWLHASHLEATVPANYLYSEMICKACMGKNEFLHDYTNIAVNSENIIVDVVTMNGIDNDKKVICNGDAKMDEIAKTSNEKSLETNVETEITETSKLNVFNSEHSLNDATECTNDENILKDEICSNEVTDTKNKNDKNISDPPKQDTNEIHNNEKFNANDTEMETDMKVLELNSKSNNLEMQPEFGGAAAMCGDTEDTIESKNIDEITEDTEKVTTQQNLNSCGIDSNSTSEEIIVSEPVNEEHQTESKELITEEKENNESITENKPMNIENDETATRKTVSDSIISESENIPVSKETVNENETKAVDSTVEPEKNGDDKKSKEQIEEDKLLADPEDDLKKTDLAEDIKESNKDNSNVISSESPKAKCDMNFDSETDKKSNAESDTENGSTMNSDIEKQVINTEDVHFASPIINEDAVVNEKDENITNCETNCDTTETEPSVEIEMKDVVSENNESNETENIPTQSVTEEEEVSTNVKHSDNHQVTELNNIEKSSEKRKLSPEESTDTEVKKPKLDETNSTQCMRPKDIEKVHKGATFWPSNFRQKLCTCRECLSMYKDLAVLFLIDPEDTATAYENLGKQKIDGKPASQYEKGLQALSSLDRVQQINALTEYNKMRDKLLDFLKSFKDRKEVVKEEDIRAFFAGMKPKREPDGVYFCR